MVGNLMKKTIPSTDDATEGDRLAHAMAILVEENLYDEAHDTVCSLAHGMELGLQAMLLHPEWALLVAKRTAQTFPSERDAGSFGGTDAGG